MKADLKSPRMGKPSLLIIGNGNTSACGMGAKRGEGKRVGDEAKVGGSLVSDRNNCRKLQPRLLK